MSPGGASGGPSSGGVSGAGARSAGASERASEAVTYQSNPAHNGSQPNDSMRLPLVRRWTRDFGDAISYPLVAEGRVFVTARHGTSYGTMSSPLTGLAAAENKLFVPAGTQLIAY